MALLELPWSALELVGVQAAITAGRLNRDLDTTILINLREENLSPLFLFPL